MPGFCPAHWEMLRGWRLEHDRQRAAVRILTQPRCQWHVQMARQGFTAVSVQVYGCCCRWCMFACDNGLQCQVTTIA